MFVFVILIFIVNWIFGFCLQIQVNRYLQVRMPEVAVPWNPAKSSAWHSIVFLKFLFSGEYKKFRDHAFELKCKILIGCFVLQTLLMGLFLTLIILYRDVAAQENVATSGGENGREYARSETIERFTDICLMVPCLLAHLLGSSGLFYFFP